MKKVKLATRIKLKVRKSLIDYLYLLDMSKGEHFYHLQSNKNLAEIYNTTMGTSIPFTNDSFYQSFDINGIYASYLRNRPAPKNNYPVKKVKEKSVKKKEPHWKDEYLAYLKTPKWKQIRVTLFKERGRKCEECDATRFLQVHHLTYVRLYNERTTDLKILCEKCHKDTHGIK